MDRTIIDPLEQMRDFDFVSFEHDVLLGFGFIANDFLSQLPSPVVAGFPATQTSTPSLSINLGAGRVYASAAADATGSGSIPQDLTNVVQQGINTGQTLTLVPPAVGQSQWNLIQVQYQQGDAVRSGDPNAGLVPFYNSSNPTQPNYTQINTVRQARAIVQVIQGSAATTGSEVPPQPTSGWTPMYLVDLSGGQTAISTSQIIKTGPSVGTGVPNNYPVAPFIAGLQASHHNGNPGQAPKINLTREVTGVLPYSNMSPVRQLLFADLQLVVDAVNGVDTNNGLTASTPFRTIQAAVNAIYHNYDFNGFKCTVLIQNGNYAAGFQCIGAPLGMTSPIAFQGNLASPGLVTVNQSNGNTVTASAGAIITVFGMTLTAGGTQVNYLALGNAMLATNGASITFGSIVFGVCGNAHMMAFSGGFITSNGNAYNISGGAYYHLCASGGVANNALSAVGLNGTPNFTGAFVLATALGYVQVYTSTYTGAATGQRYNVALNGVINTNNAGINFLPGSVAGVAQAGGQYV